MNRSSFANVKKKKIITIILVLLLTVTVLTGVLTPLMRPKTVEGETFTPMPAKTSETVEMLNDLPQDFTVDITSDKNITQDNLAEFVTVTNSKGTKTNVRIEKQNGGYYTILPPITKYEKGEYYKIQLQNAKFKDENLSSQSSILFATGKDSVTDVQIKKEVEAISGEKVVYISDDVIDLVKEKEKTYKIGNMLLLPDPEDGLGEVAYKIEEVRSDNGNIISLGVSRPSLDEVYGKVEIYGNQNPTLDDLKFFSEEEIEQGILESESVRAIGFACAVMDGEDPYTTVASASERGFGFDYDVNIEPAFKKPSKIDQDIFDIKLNPLEFSVHFKLEWEIEKINAKVTLTSETKVTFEVFTNIDNEKNIYSSGTRATFVQDVNLNIETSWSSPTFEKEQKIGMLSYFNEYEQVQNPLNPEKAYNPAWAVQSLEANANGDKKYTDLLDGRQKTAISEAATINNFIRGKSSKKSNAGSYTKGTDAARKQVQQDLSDLVSCYEQGQSGMDSNLLPFVTIAIPLPYGCSVHVRIGAKIVMNLSAVFEGNANFKYVDERVDVTTEDGTESYENKSTTICIMAIIKGSFDAKFAFAIDTKVTLARIFYISVEIEAGVYFETEGYGGVLIGDYDKDADIFSIEHEGGFEVGGAAYFFNDKIALVGHFYCDFGIYGAVTLKAGLSLDLILVKIDLSVALSYEEKLSVFDLGVDNPEYLTDLIFEDQLNGKFKNEIATGQIFKDDMLFGEEFIEFYGSNGDAAIVMDYDQYTAKAPRVLRRTINLKTKEVTYEPIPYERLHYDLDEGTAIDKVGNISQRDRLAPFIDDLVWITAEDKAGNMYPIDEFAYLRIIKDPVPVETVKLSVSSNEIYPHSEILIYAEIDPEYASYQDMQFEIVDFIHNGSSVGKDEISKYVYFDENLSSTRGKLVATDLVSIGDKVIVQGIATHDNVTSNTLELTVVRRPVSGLSFVTQNRQTTVVVGQELPFEVFVYPLNATFNKEGSKPSITVHNSDLAEIIEKDGNLILKVTNDINAFGQAVELTISADDNGKIVSIDYSMMIIQIPIDTLKITNENLTELGDRTSLNQGQSFYLVAKAEPIDATVLNKIQLLKNVDNQYVTIDKTGELRIYPNAPIGYEFTVSARYDNINSKNYHFVVDKIATEKVSLFEQNGQYEVAPNEQVLLKTKIEPSNATFFAPEFMITDGADWATIGYTGLITISEDAPIGAVIRIYASVDGVNSNSVTFRIPAKSVSVTAPNDTLKVGERMALGYDLGPTNNVLLPITFSIVEGEEYASITQSGILTVNDDVSVANARIGVVAEIDKVISAVYYINITVPITSIELYTNMSGGNVELGSSIMLSTNVYPEFASSKDVEFIVDKEELAQVNNGWLKITDDEDAIGEIIEVVATADGVVSNILRIRITKISVLEVEFIEENLECKVNIGGNKTLYASAVPGNATNKEVSYRIVAGMNLASIDGEILTISDSAPIGSKIEIVAIADGVESKEHLTVIVSKIAVERVDIAVENDVQSIAPSGTAKFNATTVPANATESIITYSIIGEGKYYAYIDAVSGELTVNPAQLIVRGDIVIQVIATADGVSSKPISLPIVVPITEITMLGGDITVECGSEVKLSAMTNSNATDNEVEYRFLNGTNLTTSNQYATIQGDILYINDNIFDPRAEVAVVAVPKGADSFDVVSNARTVRVHIPVKSVSIISNKTSIMLGESATLSASIFPAFASNQSVEYRFVDNFGEIISAPWGVSLIEDTISVLNNVAILSSTPRFMVCALVDGIKSNVWRFEVIERPVTELSFEESALKDLVDPDDPSNYRAHPGVDYGYVIKAAVNNDASFKGITFSAVAGDAYVASVAAAENLSFDGTWYSLRLYIYKTAKVGDTITILAQSQRNPQIRSEISIQIKAIYADAIVGANITAVDSKGERTILDGEEFGGNLNGYSSNYINPKDEVTFNKLYFDDELSNDYYKNVTFDDKYTLNFSHTKFITVTDRGFKVLDRAGVLEQIKPGEDSFTVTVTVDQGDGQVLTKDFKFFIFIDVKTVQFIDGKDAKGNTLTMRDDEVLYVDRNKDDTTGNEFTFHFSINGGEYTTNRLLLVNGFELSDIKDGNGYTYALEDKSGLDLMEGKTPPQITFSLYGEYSNEIKIKFSEWYNVGTKFQVVIMNPDHAAIVKKLYTFTLCINPVDESNDFRFGKDGKLLTDEVVSSADCYQVNYYDGPVAIRGIKTYADLRLGYAVELELGTKGLSDFGQRWEFVTCNNNDVNVKKIKSQTSKFIIEAKTSANDSFVENQLVRLEFKYIDGNQYLDNTVIYIRLVDLVTTNVPLQTKNGYDYKIRAEKTNLRNYVYFNFDDKTGDVTYIEPKFTVSSSVAKINDDGSTLVITNFNMESVDVTFTAKQFYNSKEIVIGGSTIPLTRRFIASVDQLKKINELGNNQGSEVTLIKDLSLKSYPNINLGTLDVVFNGNGHSIRYINYIFTDKKLNDADVYHGLFEKISSNALVKNLELQNVRVVSAKQHGGKYFYNVGVLAGVNEGTIDNVAVMGSINVERKNSIVGGIVAINRGTITNSKNSATLEGSGDMGGIAGRNDGGVINKCNNFGAMVIVYNANRSVGGITAYNYNGGSVSNCNHIGNITSENTIKGEIKVGAIIGHNQANFDGKGFIFGYTHLTYTSSEGIIFGWGSYNNGVYLFAYHNGRVGKDG